MFSIMLYNYSHKINTHTQLNTYVHKYIEVGLTTKERNATGIFN